MFTYQEKKCHTRHLNLIQIKRLKLGACVYRLVTDYKSVLALNLRFGYLYLFKLKHGGEDWLAITSECLESSIAVNGS